MPYNGKILAAARKELEQLRTSNLAEQRRRTELIYNRIPQIQEADRELRTQMSALIGLSMSQDEKATEKLQALRDRNLELQAQKAELLTENGYPINFLDDIFNCRLCRDTGTYRGGICDCLKKLYNDELNRSLSTLIRTGNESFENFRLDYYSSQFDAATQCVPRDIMSSVYDICRKFADLFPNVSHNLLMIGAPGLGKTYLSACIAKNVAANGYSVCYESASAAFDYFEQRKFSRDIEEAEQADILVRHMLECDLMILDDLGTEMLTPMASSALYTLLNTRIIHHRPIIISTNLTSEALQKRYSAQIYSRLIGEFMILPFAGSDIRTLKVL